MIVFSMKILFRVIAVLMLLLTVSAIVVGIFFRGFIEEEISIEIGRFGLIVVLFLFFLIDFLPQIISPYVMMASGSLLGLNGGYIIFFVVAGSLLGSILGFWLGHKIREHVVESMFEESSYARVRNGMNKYGRWYVLFSAVTPLPYVPVIFGSLNLSYRNFLLFGMIPRACWIAVIGSLLNGLF